jgi:hypothetical protein
VTQTQTTTLPTTEVDPSAGTGDIGPEDCAHIVDQRDPANDVTSAIVEGREVTALCGYRWIPYRQPEGRPVCEACVEVYGRLRG